MRSSVLNAYMVKLDELEQLNAQMLTTTTFHPQYESDKFDMLRGTVHRHIFCSKVFLWPFKDYILQHVGADAHCPKDKKRRIIRMIKRERERMLHLVKWGLESHHFVEIDEAQRKEYIAYSNKRNGRAKTVTKDGLIISWQNFHLF